MLPLLLLLVKLAEVRLEKECVSHAVRVSVLNIYPCDIPGGGCREGRGSASSVYRSADDICPLLPFLPGR